MARSYKKDFSFSYAIGVSPVIELLNHKGDKVTKVYIHPKGEKNSGVGKIVDSCKKLSIPIETNAGFIENISLSENTYAVAVFNKYESKLDDQKNHVVLVNPSDPGNLGTICRTMLGFGFTDLAVIKPGVDVFDPKTIRASMGAVFQLNFQYFSSFEGYQGSFKQNIYSFMTDGEELLGKVTFKRLYALVFGNEGGGLDSRYKKFGKSVRIPQSDKVDSLNLSIAVGVSLYEAGKTSIS
jgi:TrmH family RNA methyltransferase